MPYGRRDRGSVSRDAFAPRRSSFMLGFETRGSSSSGFGLLFGPTPGFTRRFVLRRHARQSRGFGDLLGTDLFGCQIGGTSFGLGPLLGQSSKFLSFPGARGGSGRQFGGGKFPALRVGKGTLLGLDSRAQRDLGQPLGMRLLCGGSLRRRLGRGTTDRLLGSELLRLLASLCGGSALDGQHSVRLCDRTGTFFRGGTGQSIRLGRPLRIGRICGSRGSALQALPLRLHQSIQQFAQAVLPVPEEPRVSGRDSLTQTWHGPKVE